MLIAALPFFDPAAAATALRGEGGFLWLDSSASGHPGARYSYICIWPVDRITLAPSSDAPGLFRRWLARFPSFSVARGAPFQGGAAGYLAYDFAQGFVERFSSRHLPPAANALEFAFYDTVIAFDHAAMTATIHSAGVSGPGAEPDMALAGQKLERLRAALAEAPQPLQPVEPVSWEEVVSPENYISAVHRAQEFIRDGDIYQANIAGLWTAAAQSLEAAFAQYIAGRARNPAPFSAFGHFSSRIIASFSPERLVALDANGRVKAEPIKGTIRRGAEEAEDAILRAELLGSEKDRAENVMIVDLLRNDLSRVCAPSSVTVSALCRLESFANLHHLVSTVEGQLTEGEDSVSLLEAVFPGGSITGAPKLRAMEVIDVLEPAARGIFCGSLGWIGFDGAMDFSILIRTLDILPTETRFWAGAGITLLSEAEAEKDEIRLKAARVVSSMMVTPEVSL